MKVLIVGFGSIGKRHLKNLCSMKNMEILILTKQKNIKKFSHKNVKFLYNFHDCILEKPTVALITNETSLHIPIAKKLVSLGIHVFIEKPISNTMKDIKKIIDITKKKKLITLVGCNLRFNDSIKKIKSLLDKKKIGRIISVKVECGTYLPDWHPDENYSNGYAARNDLGGGVVLTLIHELDYLYWFFGKVNEVISITGKFSDLNVSTNDFSGILMKFKNDVVAEIHLDYFQKPGIRSCKIIGTTGTIYWDSIKNDVKIFDNKKSKWSSVLKVKKYDRNKEYMDELKYYFDCLSNHNKSMNDFVEAKYVLSIALGIIKSSNSKKFIKILD